MQKAVKVVNHKVLEPAMLIAHSKYSPTGYETPSFNADSRTSISSGSSAVSLSAAKTDLAYSSPTMVWLSMYPNCTKHRYTPLGPILPTKKPSLGKTVRTGSVLTGPNPGKIRRLPIS